MALRFQSVIAGQMKERQGVRNDLQHSDHVIKMLEPTNQRKDLTSLEKSKNLVELAEIKERELKEKLSTDSVDKCTDSVHLNNPYQIGDRKVAAGIGGPPQTL